MTRSPSGVRSWISSGSAPTTPFAAPPAADAAPDRAGRVARDEPALRPAPDAAVLLARDFADRPAVLFGALLAVLLAVLFGAALSDPLAALFARLPDDGLFTAPSDLAGAFAADLAGAFAAVLRGLPVAEVSASAVPLRRVLLRAAVLSTVTCAPPSVRPPGLPVTWGSPAHVRGEARPVPCGARGGSVAVGTGW
ncbi:hypothetical protein TPA0909_47810 [Streptomyces albus]|nr:hypothetical protein TPA0909_47810 [Streptomyces albus]